MTRTLSLIVLLISLAGGTGARGDDGTLNVIAKFDTGSLGLAVATFTTSDGQNRVGVLAWRSGPDRNGFALRLSEWGAIFDLWKKAARAQGPWWNTIGSVSETGTTDRSRIEMKAGPGVELAIASAKGASIAYVLSPADFARFEQAMRDMKAELEDGQMRK